MFPIQFHFSPGEPVFFRIIDVLFVSPNLCLIVVTFLSTIFFSLILSVEDWMSWWYLDFSCFGIGFVSNPFSVCHEINQYVRVDVYAKITSIWTISLWNEHFAHYLFTKLEWSELWALDINTKWEREISSVNVVRAKEPTWNSKRKLQVTKINYNHFSVRFGNFNLIWPFKWLLRFSHIHIERRLYQADIFRWNITNHTENSCRNMKISTENDVCVAL